MVTGIWTCVHYLSDSLKHWEDRMMNLGLDSVLFASGMSGGLLMKGKERSNFALPYCSSPTHIAVSTNPSTPEIIFSGVGKGLGVEQGRSCDLCAHGMQNPIYDVPSVSTVQCTDVFT